MVLCRLARPLIAATCMAGHAHAFTVTLAPAARTVYLQVGVGGFATPFNAGGTPANNPTVNVVSVTVPPAQLGTGPLQMTSDSTVSRSAYDNFVFCNPPVEVYVGGYTRSPTGGGTTPATLTVQAPTVLTNAATGFTIPFSTVSWTSGGIGDATPTIPAGTFSGTGTAQTLLSVARNTWFESCLTFTYANNQRFAAGTYTGRVVYTLTLP